MNKPLDNYTDAELVAMPRPNIKLLDEVLDYIIDHPKEWNQRYWTLPNEESQCGTTFCFAGHAACLSGIAEIEKGVATLAQSSGFGPNDWFEAGMAVLGLTDQEAADLFENTLTGDHYNNDAVLLKRVKVQVERIRARAKAQDAAFNRLAQEFIDAAGLDDVVKPGYTCPESAEVLQGTKGGANE